MDYTVCVSQGTASKDLVQILWGFRVERWAPRLPVAISAAEDDFSSYEPH